MTIKTSRLVVLTSAFKAKKTNAECLAIVKRRFPRSEMTLATVNWYRNKFRREGMAIPSEHALR